MAKRVFEERQNEFSKYYNAYNKCSFFGDLVGILVGGFVSNYHQMIYPMYACIGIGAVDLIYFFFNRQAQLNGGKKIHLHGDHTELATVLDLYHNFQVANPGKEYLELYKYATGIKPSTIINDTQPKNTKQVKKTSFNPAHMLALSTRSGWYDRFIKDVVEKLKEISKDWRVIFLFSYYALYTGIQATFINFMATIIQKKENESAVYETIVFFALTILPKLILNDSIKAFLKYIDKIEVTQKKDNLNSVNEGQMYSEVSPDSLAIEIDSNISPTDTPKGGNNGKPILQTIKSYLCFNITSNFCSNMVSSIANSFMIAASSWLLYDKKKSIEAIVLLTTTFGIADAVVYTTINKRLNTIFNDEYHFGTSGLFYSLISFVFQAGKVIFPLIASFIYESNDQPGLASILSCGIPFFLASLVLFKIDFSEKIKPSPDTNDSDSETSE